MGITSQNHLGLGITTISNIEHESYTIQTSHQTSSTGLPGLLLCWSQNYITALFLGLSCTKSCSNACFFFFFSRFVGHQVVLRCIFFFAVCRAPNRAPMRAFFSKVCRAPNRAPMRAFFRGLPSTKLCSNACLFSRFVVHQIVLQCVFFFSPVYRAPNRVLLCGSLPGVSFGKLLLVVFLQCLQFLIFHEGIDCW